MVTCDPRKQCLLHRRARWRRQDRRVRSESWEKECWRGTAPWCRLCGRRGLCSSRISCNTAVRVEILDLPSSAEREKRCSSWLPQQDYKARGRGLGNHGLSSSHRPKLQLG